jgi:hypothetical protein
MLDIYTLDQSIQAQHAHTGFNCEGYAEECALKSCRINLTGSNRLITKNNASTSPRSAKATLLIRFTHLKS